MRPFFSNDLKIVNRVIKGFYFTRNASRDSFPQTALNVERTL